MSKTNEMEDLMLRHYFENATHANWGDAAGLLASAAAGNVFISLHTADPGEAGTQLTSEATYTSYARVTVARGAANWTTASGTNDNDNAITFPQATGGSSTVTFFGVGSATSGAGNLYYSGALTASLAVTNGVQPQFDPGDCNISED